LITISVLHSLSVHDTATTEIYTLSLHDALPISVLVSFTLNILLRELGAADLSGAGAAFGAVTQVGPMVTVLIVAGAGATAMCAEDRKSTRLNSSHVKISYAVFCLKKKKNLTSAN